MYFMQVKKLLQTSSGFFTPQNFPKVMRGKAA
jgi:hypothetical protein